MDFEIEPEPDETTRKAILAAFADEDADEPEPSPWAQELLPERDDAA